MAWNIAFRRSVISCILILACCQSREIRQTYYVNGAIKERIPLVNGMKHGEVLTFYEDGTVRSRAIYVNDTLHGTFTTYTRKGVVDSIANYVKGVPHGQFFKFYPNGNIAASGNFRNGLLAGIYAVYFPSDSGRVREEAYAVTFDHTVLQYFNRKYDRDGKLLAEYRPLRVFNPDSVRLHDTITVSFEFIESTFDSVRIVAGIYDDKLNPVSRLDTIRLIDGKATHKWTAERPGTNFLRGQWLGHRETFSDADSIYEYIDFSYFEEAVRVY